MNAGHRCRMRSTPYSDEPNLTLLVEIPQKQLHVEIQIKVGLSENDEVDVKF
jgi:hypothetical protein